MNQSLINHLNQAIKCLEDGNLIFAESILNSILQIDPKNLHALHIYGIVKGQQGNAKEAIEFFQKAVEINPNDGAVHFNLAKAMMDDSQYAGSISHHKKSTELMPANCDAWINYGCTLNELGLFKEAFECQEKAIQINVNDAEAWSNRGVALKELNRLEEALASYDKALAIKPDYHEAWSNRGVALKELNRLEEALASYDKALAIKPDYHEAWSNRGVASDDLKQYEEGLACYDKAISLKPNYADAHWNKALNQLVRGDFKNGWENYEYRWHCKNISIKRHQEIPELTDLKNASGKRVLVWSEQGYGDVIQFSRFIKILISLKIDVVFEVWEPVKELFKESFRDAYIITQSEYPGIVDFQVALLSLPKLFSIEANNIPSTNQYINTNSKTSDLWNKRLKLSKNELNIGIACSGSSTHLDDKNRSIDLSFFEPISKRANLFLIQKDLKEKDRSFLQSHPKIHFLGDVINSFLDTASILRSMDIVITVDTSLAHLSAALGKPTLILLAWAPEWRWLLDREDSPWYPTAKLFRQPNPGNWRAVIDDVASFLDLASFYRNS